MADNFTVTRIKVSTLEQIRKMAKAGKRSPVDQLDLMAEAFSKMGVVDIQVLDGPEGAQAVPVITVQAQA